MRFNIAHQESTLADRVRNYFLANGDDEDIDAIERFIRLSDPDFFGRFDSVDEFMTWAADGLLPLMAELDASEKVSTAIANDQGIPSESDLEDALNWAECAAFQGSEKQIRWARAIATDHIMAIAIAHKQGKQVPTDARWWIDNRNNIVVNLPI